MSEPGRVAKDVWESVDRYVSERLAPHDAALESALASSAAAGLPAIQVSPSQGKLLMLLARMVGARRILEIGTLGGYSTIWLARGLATDGGGLEARVVTLESDPRHAEVARGNIARAGLASVVEIRVGPALETLPVLAANRTGRFDLVFIDADKPNIPEYLDWALRLSRAGGVIVIDNVVRDGEVANAASDDPSVRGVQRMFDRLAHEPRVSATALQTVGSKGYDGLAIAVVVGETSA